MSFNNCVVFFNHNTGFHTGRKDGSKTELIIPYERLSIEALNGLIEEFVTRPGTDTGYTIKTLEQNVDTVKRQLRRGDVFIVFDDDTKTANIVPKDMVRFLLKDQE